MKNDEIQADVMAQMLNLDRAQLTAPQYSMTVHQWMAHRLNAVNWDLVQLPPEFVVLRDRLAYIRVGPIPELTEVQLTVTNAANWADTWTAQTDDQLLAFLEASSHEQYENRRLNSIGSYFTALTCLVKGDNVTSDWIMKRLERIQAMTGGRILTDVLTSDIYDQFKTIYTKQGLTPDSITCWQFYMQLQQRAT